MEFKDIVCIFHDGSVQCFENLSDYSVIHMADVVINVRTSEFIKNRYGPVGKVESKFPQPKPAPQNVVINEATQNPRSVR